MENKNKMRIKKLSNLRKHEGLYLVFDREGGQQPLHRIGNKFVDRIEVDVSNGITNIRVRYIEPPQHGYQHQSTQEDVIYVFDQNGRYSHAAVLSEFAQVRRVNPDDTTATKLGNEETSFEPMDEGLERKIRHLVNQELHKRILPSNS
tara:strand:- start:55 stop:498 length:444 start_codon:yes stop_codon:yes gene_type:complete